MTTDRAVWKGVTGSRTQVQKQCRVVWGHQCLHTSQPSKLRNGTSTSAFTIITNQGRGRHSPCRRVCRRHIPELGESERLHRGQGGPAKQNSLRGLWRESGGPYLLSLGPCWCLGGHMGALPQPHSSPSSPCRPFTSPLTGPSMWMSHGQSDTETRNTLAKRNQLFLWCYWNIFRSSSCPLHQGHYLFVLLSQSPLRPSFLRHLLGHGVLGCLAPPPQPPSVLTPTPLFSGRTLAVSCAYRSAELLLTQRWTQDSEASSFCLHEGAKLMHVQRAEEVVVPTPGDASGILEMCSEMQFKFVWRFFFEVMDWPIFAAESTKLEFQPLILYLFFFRFCKLQQD